MPRKTCKEDIKIRVADFPENSTEHGQVERTALQTSMLVFISAKTNLNIKQSKGAFLLGGVHACTTPPLPRIKQPHLANGNTTEVMIIFFQLDY